MVMETWCLGSRNGGITVVFRGDDGGVRSLSHSISIGLLFDGMTFLSPSINFLIQTASINASVAAIYSASIEDITVVLCLALFQSTAPPLMANWAEIRMVTRKWPNDQDFKALSVLGDHTNFNPITGKVLPDDFIDWLSTVERVFDVRDIPDKLKVKLVAINHRQHDSLWWDHVTKRRRIEGKSKVET
ncbi:hypothetical protein Tco_0902717 [Tanacetum coccineum]